ncbi:unnamed protein product [Brassicogethes aeneus]|uniref:CCHC-type domain-containing protein n=1 Tax=Brassicogethes aeneus TaxID=1431903 RepID=A0A9P0BGR5_BRAAE|nr:unnamed protein product [Brassicogethes aeneus]
MAIYDDYCQVTRKHKQLKAFINGHMIYEIIVVKFPTLPTQQQVIDLIPMHNLGKAVVSPKSEKDWHCSMNFFGKQIKNRNEINRLVYDDRVGEDSLAMYYVRNKVQLTRLTVKVPALLGKLWSYDFIPCSLEDAMLRAEANGEVLSDCIVCALMGDNEIRFEATIKMGSDVIKATNLETPEDLENKAILTESESIVNNLNQGSIKSKEENILKEKDKIIQQFLDATHNIKTKAQLEVLRSYSDNSQAPNGKTVPTTNTSVVLVYPDADNEHTKSFTSDQTRAALTTILRPRQTGCKIDKVNKLPAGGLRLESSKFDLSALSTQALKEKGLVLRVPTKRPARLAIYHVPALLDAEEVEEAIIAQNSDGLTNDQQDILKDGVLVKFKFGPRDSSTVHWIVQTTPRARKIILNNDQLYIGMSKCRVSDHIRVTRCHNCQQYGHMSSSCRAKAPACAHCAKQHNTDKCPTNNQDPICIN